MRRLNSHSRRRLHYERCLSSRCHWWCCHCNSEAINHRGGYMRRLDSTCSCFRHRRRAFYYYCHLDGLCLHLLVVSLLYRRLYCFCFPCRSSKDCYSMNGPDCRCALLLRFHLRALCMPLCCYFMMLCSFLFPCCSMLSALSEFRQCI